MDNPRFQTFITVNESFRDLIKRQNYEKYVFTIIQKSKKVFSGRTFTQINQQSCGQCDYIDEQGQKYDAKLIFDKNQGSLIGEPKNTIDLWIQEMMSERAEFSDVIQNRDLTRVCKTKLYNIMKQRIESLQPDENGILFIPFPIVNDVEGSVFLQLATDFLQAVYDQLKMNGVIEKRKVYFIYPSMEPHIYTLRNSERIREYIRCDELKDVIEFRTAFCNE